MKTTIRIKRTDVAGRVPAKENLEQGELALNLTDKKIFTKNASDEVVELGALFGDHVNQLPLRFESLNTNIGYRIMSGLGKNGKLYTWGEDESTYWSLGTGPTAGDVNGFNEIILPYERCGKIVHYFTRHSSTYILFENNEMWAFGQNHHGQLGCGNQTNQAFPIKILDNVAEMIEPVGGDMNPTYIQMLVKMKSGEYKVWGSNSGDRLPTSATADYVTTPTNVVLPSGYTFSDIKKVWKTGSYLGGFFFQFNNNKLFACGYNGYGALGIGNTTADIKAFTEVKVLSGIPIKTIKASPGYSADKDYSNTSTYFLTEDGRVFTVGDNNWGQLGHGNTTDLSTPKQVAGLETIGELIISGDGPCGVWVGNTSKTKLWRWGYNSDRYMLGNNATASVYSPLLLNQPYKKLYTNENGGNSYGYYNPLVLEKVDGTYLGWGSNGSQQLMLNSSSNIKVPTSLRNIYQTFKTVKINCSGKGNGCTQIYWLTEDGILYVSGHLSNVGLVMGNMNTVATNPISALRRMTA